MKKSVLLMGAYRGTNDLGKCLITTSDFRMRIFSTYFFFRRKRVFDYKKEKRIFSIPDAGASVIFGSGAYARKYIPSVVWDKKVKHKFFYNVQRTGKRGLPTTSSFLFTPSLFLWIVKRLGWLASTEVELRKITMAVSKQVAQQRRFFLSLLYSGIARGLRARGVLYQIKKRARFFFFYWFV